MPRIHALKITHIQKKKKSQNTELSSRQTKLLKYLGKLKNLIAKPNFLSLDFKIIY